MAGLAAAGRSAMHDPALSEVARAYARLLVTRGAGDARAASRAPLAGSGAVDPAPVYYVQRGGAGGLAAAGAMAGQIARRAAPASGVLAVGIGQARGRGGDITVGIASDRPVLLDAMPQRAAQGASVRAELPVEPGAEAAAVLARINESRHREGLTSLGRDQELSKLAVDLAGDVLRTGRADAKPLSARIRPILSRSGRVALWTVEAILAAHPRDAAERYASELHPATTHLGIGVAVAPGGGSRSALVLLAATVK